MSVAPFKSDVELVRYLYGLTQQKSTIAVLKKDLTKEIATKIAQKEKAETTLGSSNLTKGQRGSLEHRVQRLKEMIVYLERIAAEEKAAGKAATIRIIFTREPKVYALNPRGDLVGIGYSKETGLLAIKAPYGTVSASGTTFQELGLNSPPQLFYRETRTDGQETPSFFRQYIPGQN